MQEQTVERGGPSFGLAAAIIGLFVAAVVVAVNVFGVGIGTSNGKEVCDRAAACCEKVKNELGNDSSSCKNMRKIGVPDSACHNMLDSMKKLGSTKDITCG